MLCLRVVPPLPPLLATLEAKQQKKLDGVYMSSSVPDSEKVWNYQVNDESLEWELENGNVESIRERLPGQGELLKPGQVYWMSDRAPHESLPMTQTTMSQFFRITTSEVGFWYKDQYTANPLGVLPDPNVTDIVVGKELSEEKLKLVHDWKEEGYKQMNRIKNERRRPCPCMRCFFINYILFLEAEQAILLPPPIPPPQPPHHTAPIPPPPPPIGPPP